MKKKELKFAVKKAMARYYSKGLYLTAANVRTELFEAIDKSYSKKHKK